MKITLLGLVVLFCVTAVSCKNETSTMKEFDPNFAHVVYFWLKNPDSQEDRKAFEASLKKFLSTSEYAQTQFIGQPANTPRDVVDNSWTYSIILTFPSKEIQNKYQQEPVHLKFIEESEHLWERVQVYDAVGLE